MKSVPAQCSPLTRPITVGGWATARSSANDGRERAVMSAVSHSQRPRLGNVPIVSVVVIGYNDAEHLPTAVASVTGQSLRDIEVIVVDDASTDGMDEIAAALARGDPRVRVLRLDRNSGGCSRPRNVGMAATTGRYVMFLDSDD